MKRKGEMEGEERGGKGKDEVGGREGGRWRGERRVRREG